MLSIRMQRRGRKKLAQYRIIVQDSRFTPTSGKVVEYLGSHDPHAKTTILDKEKAQKFLDNGAQPSDRAARILKGEGIKMPSWVKMEDNQKRTTRNPDKLRKNQPKEEPAVEEAPAPVAEAPAEEAPVEAVEEKAPEAAEETKEVVEEKTEEAPAEKPEAAKEEVPAKEEEKTDAK